MHSFLQTKAFSLAAEAKYIRKQELRFCKQRVRARLSGKDRLENWAERNREGQYLHRIFDVRQEARATNLARGFLKGREYKDIENKTETYPNFAKIWTLVARYAERDNPRWNDTIENIFKDWHQRALQYLDEQHPM